MDVEKLCYFIEISMLLPIFDDLKEGNVHSNSYVLYTIRWDALTLGSPAKQALHL